MKSRNAGNKEFIAHRREKDGESQSLCSHLSKTAIYAGQFANKIGLKDSGRIIGLLHDIGKASNAFDKYIQSATGYIDPDADDYVDAKEQRGKIDHSSAGAQIIYRTLSKNGPEGIIAAQVLSLCIASHHSGLIDCLMPSGEDNFTRRINKSGEKTHTEEALSYLLDNEMQKLTKLLSSESLVKQIIGKIKSLKENSDYQDTAMFKYGLLVRFLFSCLIDADRLNTADFEFPKNTQIRNYGKYHPWNILVDRLNVKIQEFEHKKDKNEVDDLRNEVSKHCVDFATKPKGIYQLSVPTGGGKTLASLRFALNHAAVHKMDRVFYIIPFTSIIDQNADEVRKILEDKDINGKYLDRVVLEHHSNLTPEEETKRQNLLSENWDAPVVFTTQVQFLETLFGSGTRSVRRMHQIANSVIIFDEVQTIPVRCVHMFNIALRFLVNNCGASVVLCTATQPLLDKIDPVQRSLSICPEQKMIQNEKELFQKLKRIEVFDVRKETDAWSEDEVVNLTEQELKEMGSVLIIVNKKDSARSLYQKLAERKFTHVYHLSTNMCPAHRLNVLNIVKDRLDKKQPVICVSTQLIEAGVDIDFGTVIRYMAGLDSIAQAAGRCNRNGRRDKPGRIYIVNPKDESLDKLKDIKIGAGDADRVLREFKNNPELFDNDCLGIKAMEQFYKYYFYNRSKEMSYPVTADNAVIGRADNLFNLMALNSISVAEYKRVHNASPSIPLKQSFQSAAKAFHAIDSPTRGVIVQYGKNGKKLVKSLCAIDRLKKPRFWFKMLKLGQRYSVNIYPYVFDDLYKQRAIHEIQKDTGIFYLDNENYSDEFGLSKEIVNEMEIYIK
ncbi:MAG: CRISPR-associated helicase Cas3' [Ignavibacteriaceae bacterium]